MPVRIKAMPVLERAMIVRRRAITFLLSAKTVRSRASPVVAHTPGFPGLLRSAEDATFRSAPFLEAGHTKSHMPSPAVILLTTFRPSLPARRPGKYHEKPSKAMAAPTRKTDRENTVHGP